MTSNHIWLYAVVPADALPVAEISGVAGEPLYAVPGPGIAAVVGQVPRADFDEEPLHANLEDAAWLNRTVRAHHQAVEALARTGPVLPIRYATLYRDESGVAAILNAHSGQFLAGLDRLTGCTEWGVKVYAVPSSSAEAESHQPADEQHPGTAYLLRRKARHLDRQQALQRACAEADQMHQALAAAALDSTRHPLQKAEMSGRTEPMVLNGAYLVDAGRRPALDEVIASFAAAHDDLSVEVTGPWPAYSFTDIGGLTERK